MTGVHCSRPSRFTSLELLHVEAVSSRTLTFSSDERESR